MNRKILTLLIVLIAAISIVGVCASEELVSHDFGKFKMDIGDGQAVTESQGSVNQTIFNVTNKDGSNAFSVVYYDTSNTNGNNNTTDFVLNTGYKNIKDKETKGNLTTFTSDNGIDKVYCVSSKDNTKVVVIIGGDTRIPQMIDSIKFN